MRTSFSTLVRESYATGEPILWEKVNKVPDFVYFNHSIHVNKGVGCATCHGQINQMPVVWKSQAFYMGWCLNCHRNPEQYVRPREEVYNMDYVAVDQLATGRNLVIEYGIAPPGRCADAMPIRILPRVACPRCGSTHTERLSAFGATACKALHRCLDCREPFEHFKPL